VRSCSPNCAGCFRGRSALGGPRDGAGAMARILYVEDNEDNAFMLVRWLKREGFETAVARDGAHGVAAARDERPDLILMDLSLPILDGWEATRRIKEAPETRGIPIIALSAHAMSGDREQALSAGCDDYDSKPVDFGRLLGKIRALLPEGGGT
jgi:two-component system cell cycle response regulator DivK